jgi:hypothetical protein
LAAKKDPFDDSMGLCVTVAVAVVEVEVVLPESVIVDVP